MAEVAGARSAADLAGSRGLSSQQLRALNKALKGIKARRLDARNHRQQPPRGVEALPPRPRPADPTAHRRPADRARAR